MSDKKQYQIAIIGNKDTILGFKALGMTTVAVTNVEEAVTKLYELKKTTITEDGEDRAKYAIIFITEDLAMEVPKKDFDKLSESALPAIIPVPNSKGSTGFGLKRVGQMVEKAVGSDIFGN